MLNAQQIYSFGGLSNLIWEGHHKILHCGLVLCGGLKTKTLNWFIGEKTETG